MEAIIVTGKLLIDGTGRAPIQNGAVRIENGRIAGVGRFAEMNTTGATIIDRGEETILPGLIDAHTHLSIIPGLGNQLGQIRAPAAQSVLRAIPNMRADLRSGVTTMRVVGEEHFLDVDIKAAVNSGRIPGPRLMIATRTIAPRHGHGLGLVASDGPDEIRQHVRENLAAGADLIKFFATGGVSSARAAADTCFYSPEEIKLIVELAHRDGRPAAVHAHGGPAIRYCVEAGIDTIEHGKLATADDFAMMRKAVAWLVTNNAISHHPDGIEKGDGGNPEIMAKLRISREASARNFSDMLGSGVKWALGTDSMHGLIWFEAQKAVEWGATNEQALAAVTRNAADAMGWLDRVGTLEVGKLGDVVSVRGNPLSDINALRAVGLVMKEGRRFDQLSEV